MEVTKSLPLDPGAARTGTVATPNANATPTSTAGATAAAPALSTAASTNPQQQGSALPGNVTVVEDRVNIQPLDLEGALQILIAEVRAELALPVGAPTAATPVPAPRALLQMFLQTLPEATREPAAWLVAVTRAEGALIAALDRGIDAISGWRAVSPAVVQGAQEIRSLIVTALGDEPPNPLWLRPEWLGLAPTIQRYWRRRRLARRGLSDPDLGAHDGDADLEHARPRKR